MQRRVSRESRVQETSGSGFSEIHTTSANTEVWTDNTVSDGTTYYYIVLANNANGDSDPSNESSATTLPFPSTAPSALNASETSQTQINLSWSDNSDNETGFEIWRAPTSGGTYALRHTTGAGETSWSDTGLDANTQYFYNVLATNTGGDSDFSSETSATTLPNAPSAPSGLSASAVSQTQINLSWTDNSSTETGFEIFRSTTSGSIIT